jgi:hypothetical protein
MEEIIKKWLDDHQINLPEDRIEMLATMIRTKESEKVSILQDIVNWLAKNRFKEIHITYSNTAFVMRVEDKQ